MVVSTRRQDYKKYLKLLFLLLLPPFLSILHLYLLFLFFLFCFLLLFLFLLSPIPCPRDLSSIPGSKHLESFQSLPELLPWVKVVLNVYRL